MVEYIEAVCREIVGAALCRLHNKKIDTIYIGGGTPSILSYNQLAKIINTLSSNFKISKNAEITIEVNPESASSVFFTKAKKLGINRISIGLQTHDDKILKQINRLHNYEMFEIAVSLAQKAGIDNVSTDIILGLPNQDKESVIKSLELLTGFSSVKHISMYGLTLEEDTALYKQGFRVNADKQADLYDMAVEYLASKNFARYEISNFAKPNYKSKHNQKYWTGENYYGFGAGAHSLIDGVRIENNADIKAYIEYYLMQTDEQNYPPLRRVSDFNMTKKKQATFVGVTEGNCSCLGIPQYQTHHILTLQEKIEEYIMLGLRTTVGINLTKLKQKYDYDLLSAKKNQIEKLLSQNLLQQKEDNITVSPHAFYVMNAIVVELI